MVVTDNFIYIHSPKSGGTFATEMLIEAASRNSGFNACNLTDLNMQAYGAFLNSGMRFLRTESLNEDLVELLVESGIARQETTFILDHRKIIPKPAERKSIRAWLGYLSSRLPRSLIAPSQQKTTNKEKRWQALYSAADIDFVLRRDRLYFTLFLEMQPVHTGTGVIDKSICGRRL